jgi:hypothetical protein
MWVVFGRLRVAQLTDLQPARPLILVAHSLGGEKFLFVVRLI